MKNILIRSFLLVIFFIITRVLITWDPFYEDGNYINYMKSFLLDFDINIINQQSELYNWMVTPSFYDTVQHTFLQTPFLLITALPELVVSRLFNLGDFFFNYYFSSYLYSLISLFSGFYFTSLALREFELKLKNTDALVLLFGSSLFYFSFFRYNVLEVFAFALVARVFYLFANQINNKKVVSPFLDSFIIAILFCLKPAYIPLIGYVAGVYLLREVKQAERVKFLGIFIALLAINYAFWFHKYGVFPDTTEQFSAVMNYSALLFFSKFLLLFELKGFVWANPALFVGTIGAIIFTWKKLKQKKFSIYATLALCGWLLASYIQTFFINMPLLDDHLVGRLNFTSLPLMILGFCFFSEKYFKKESFKKFISIAIILISLFSTFYYISHDLQGHFSYAQSKAVSLDQMLKGLKIYISGIKENLKIMTHNGFEILLILILMNILSICTMKIKPIAQRNFKKLALSFIIYFVSIFGVSYFRGEINIDKMKKNNEFSTKAIVDGEQIFVFYYVMDHFMYNYSIRDKGSKAIVLDAVNRYYDLIETQVIKSNERLDLILKERPLDVWSNY